MPVVSLTDLSLRAIKSPATGQVTYWDKSVKGFNVRASRGGALTFTVVYGHHRRRTTIGRFPLITLAKARTRAKAILAEHTLNRGKISTIKFAVAFDRFIELHLRTKNKRSTGKETERLIRRHLLPRLGNRLLEDVTKQSVAEIIDELVETPSACRHLYTAAKTFFHFCERRGYLDRSPLYALEAPTRAVSRDRALSPTEVIVLWRTAQDSGSYGKLLQLLLLTGQRLGQIAALRTEFIDHDKRIISWPSELMKGGKLHTIPYGTVTAQLLETLPKDGLLFPTERGGPFNNWSTMHHRFLKASGLTHFTRHDLRRTYSTLQASIGTPLHITELLLAHRGGTISGVAAIYNRYSFIEEMRKAIETYETHLATLCQIS